MRKTEFISRVRACERRLYRIARTMLRNDADCEDAVQETLLKAWAGRGGLRNEAYFETWLIRILINQCKSFWRRGESREAELTADIPQTASGAEDFASQVQDIHTQDAAEGFGLSIDEAVWEGEKLFVSYTVTVPEEGGPWLVGVYTPKMNGEKMDYNEGAFFDTEDAPQATVMGGEYALQKTQISKMILDKNWKEAGDQNLEMRAVFMKATVTEVVVDPNAVWCTPKGTYYHSEQYCMGMRGAQETTEAEAEALGKKPCPECR